jgi:hypothetical protein
MKWIKILGCLLIFLIRACPLFADVSINKIQDYDFGTVMPSTPNIKQDYNFCVYNSVNPRYFVTITSTNSTGSAFKMKRIGSTHYLRYSAFWNDEPSVTGNIELSSGVRSSLQQGAHNGSVTCEGGYTANLQLEISSTDLSTAPAGTYTDFLTILIEPE